MYISTYDTLNYALKFRQQSDASAGSQPVQSGVYSQTAVSPCSRASFSLWAVLCEPLSPCRCGASRAMKDRSRASPLRHHHLNLSVTERPNLSRLCPDGVLSGPHQSRLRRLDVVGSRLWVGRRDAAASPAYQAAIVLRCPRRAVGLENCS